MKCCSKICSKNQQSVGGRKSALTQNINRRSKNEIYFSELCKKKFNNVITNECMFNGWDADVILPNEKIAILWNGRWHYNKITKKHSVEQVQNRDRLKLNEINNCGYTPYVIKDMGSENHDFVEEQFKIFCDNLDSMAISYNGNTSLS